MKKIVALMFILLFMPCLFSCSTTDSRTDILTSTQPLYFFTTRLCTDTGLTVDCLVTENITCLHNYTLQPKQMRAIESAQLVIISGAGLEESFEDILVSAKNTMDASVDVPLLCNDGSHAHATADHDHHHEHDPHIWLSPRNAQIMTQNIYKKLCETYPQHQELFNKNLAALNTDFEELCAYAQAQLSDLSSRNLVTFHDGFSYLADSFDLTILEAIEEESGRESSAAELIYLCHLIEEYNVPCIFTEYSGSISAAEIISAETGVDIHQLDMAMSSNNYFDAMYHNIDTLKEALR